MSLIIKGGEKMAQKKLKGMKENLKNYFFDRNYSSVEVKQLMESYLKDIGDYPLDSLHDISVKQGFGY